MPVAPIICPSCHIHLAVDVNQEVSKQQGSSYGESGRVITVCRQCGSYITLEWRQQNFAMAKATAELIDPKMAREAIANGTPVVVNASLSPEEYDLYTSED